MPGLDRAGAQRQVSLAALQLVIDVLERAQQN
jgi:hypothetical protein